MAWRWRSGSPLEGCHVLCADIDGAAAETAATKIGAGAVGHQVDISDEEQVVSMVDACVASFGGVDKLVANAGVVHMASLVETTVEDFDRVIAINLRGAWLCTKHAVPKMIERGGGAIVNMSSLAGHIAVGGNGVYGMSKAGISHLSRITAAELRSSNIRSNALLPAFVDTPMQQSAMTMFDESLGEGGGAHDDLPIAGSDGRTGGDGQHCGVPVVRRRVDDHRHHSDRRRRDRCRALVGGQERLVRMDNAMAVISSATPAYRVRCHVRATSSMKLIAAATSRRASATRGPGYQLTDQVNPYRLAIGLIPQIAVAHFGRGVRQFGNGYRDQIRSVHADPDMPFDERHATVALLPNSHAAHESLPGCATHRGDG